LNYTLLIAGTVTALLCCAIGVVLELTHNHGSENDSTFRVNNGNVEPHRGFGHLAVMTSDVYAACEELERKGVKFQKRPDEGRMKGLAFVLGECKEKYK
jgi:lactoylglutathione lyase